MATQKKSKSELVKTNDSNTHTAILPLDQTPDYLKGNERSGMETLGQGDFKIPRIKLLQALSPEVKTFPGKAIPGEFWHSGLNISLGSDFTFVPSIAGKRVILFNPRTNGGGILAFSRDAVKWHTGGNEKHSVNKIFKGQKDAIIWDTKKDVQSSGLLEWGSSIPDDGNSQPAATLIYEYLCYLPDMPNLSPCVMGLAKTALSNARQFNTALLMLHKPTASVAVRCFADEKNEGDNSWFVPAFEPKGFVSKQIFEAAKALADQHASYQTNYDASDVEDTPKTEETNY